MCLSSTSVACIKSITDVDVVDEHAKVAGT